MRHLVVIAVLILSSTCLAQQYYFRNYTGDDGLSQIVSTTLFQDRDGYIWIGTQAGLNCFDGNKFEIFSIRQGLSNDRINAITQDSSGTFWIGTGGGLSRYEPGRFQNYLTSDGLPGLNVFDLAVDASGDLWCATVGGLCRWDGSNFQTFSEKDGLGEFEISKLLVDGLGRLWVGTRKGLFYYDQNQFKSFHPLKNQAVLALAEDRYNQLWVALARELKVFNNEELVAQYSEEEGLQGFPLTSICAGKDGVIWIGTDEGLARVRKGVLQYIEDSNGLPFLGIKSILEDHEGMIWLAGLGGVAKFQGRAFTNYTKKEGLGANNVFQILRDRNGILWAATIGGLSRFEDGLWQNFTTEDGLYHNYVWPLMEDTSGRLWIGTRDGVNYFDGRHFVKDSNKETRGVIQGLTQDSTGAIWCGVRNKGLFKRIGPNQYEQVAVPNQSFSWPMILTDRQGNIWVSGDHGLSKWDGRTWKTFNVDDGLASNDPYYLCEDFDGRIWFGYRSSHGVTYYDGRDFTTLTSADGLFNDAVYSIGADHENNIWIGTARGVDRYDGQAFINFGKTEGYASYESNAGGFFADSDGTIWFGTGDGLSHYDPSYSLVDAIPTTPKIHQLVIGGERAKLDAEITIPFSKNDLQVSVAPLVYSNEKRLNYRYRLLGYDDSWKQLTGYKINFTNLPAGNFALQVQGQKYQGDWSKPAEINFTIDPPFWATWWFMSLCLVVLMSAVLALVYWRTKSLENQRRKLERVVDERTKDIRKLSLVVSETDNAVIIANADGRIEWVNQGFTRMYGLTLQELKDLKGEYISEASDNPDIETTLRAAIHERKSLVYNSMSRGGDGRELHLSSTLTPIFDQDGDLESVVIIDTDITELKQQEKALRLTQFSIDRAGDAVFWIKPGGQFFYANQTACLSLGYEKEELLTMQVQDITDVYQERNFEKTWDFIKQSGSTTFESKHIRKDGHAFPVEVTANYLRFDEQEYICAFARDISERKQAEAALLESQERFHVLAESAFEGISISDGDKIIDANKRLAEMFGYSNEELIGKNPLDFVAPECREMVNDYRNEEHEEPFEYLAVRKDGSVLTVEVQAKSISYDGRMVRVAAIRDITERKGIEEELTALNELLLNNEKKLSAANRQLSASLEQVKAQESVLRENERKYRTLFNQIADPIFIFEKASRKFLDCNEAVHRIYGYSKNNLASMTPLDLHPPEDLEKVKENIDKRNLDKPNSYTHVTKDGKRIAVEILTDEIDYQGCAAWMSIVRDITERKEAADELRELNERLKDSQHDLSAANQELMASLQQLKAHEEALRESQERLRLIIDTAHDAVVVIDEAGIITNWNKQAEKIFGWARSDILRKQLANLIIPERYREAHKTGVKSHLEKGPGSLLNKRIETTALRKNGEEFPIELTVTALRLGESTTFSAFIRDITESMQAAEEIRSAKEKAEAANRELRRTNQHLEQATLLAKEMAIQAELASGAKSEFLANMSHEIRTPLNAIIGMTELAIETDLSPEQHGYLNVVQSSSEGLLCLINDILDFSKIEAGQMEIERIDFVLRDVIEGVAEMLSARASTKNLELLCDIDSNIPATLVGDPTRLRQIMINLTGNAIKFTERGEVVIRVEFTHREEDRVGLHFSVSDTGIGISPANIEKIFEKFSQEDTSTTRKFGGTGLGLNISMSLVELMGGELWVESEEGQGSTFQFKLSLPVGQSKKNNVEPDDGVFKETKVLIVDDSEANRLILRKMLESRGLDVIEADGGSRALAILQDPQQAPIPVALVDQKMPGMDGLELAREIRKDRSLQNTKLVLLSSLVSLSKQQQEKLDIAGAILKPVKAATLFDSMRRVLKIRSTDTETGDAFNTAGSPEKKISGHILLVEDNVSNQKLTTKILEKNSHRVGVAENGELAVKAFIKHRYDLILMDIYMPEMDGFEATEKIREWERQNQQDRIPIIALTAHAIEGYREKCLDGDMDDFITKPIKKRILLDTIEKWLDPRPIILIVDDSPDNRQLLIHHFENDGGYQYLTAENGKVAIEIVKRRPVSLILMDIEMPIMNGYAATRAIRELDNGKHLPILALTAHNDKKRLDKCMKAGCTSCLLKPLRKKKLFEAITEFLEQEPVKIHRVDELPQSIHQDVRRRKVHQTGS